MGPDAARDGVALRRRLGDDGPRRVRGHRAPLLDRRVLAQPRALGFNAGVIYAQNKDHKLIRYSPKSGARDAYRFETRGRTLSILPYPSSSEERVLVLTETDLLWVDFDAK